MKININKIIRCLTTFAVVCMVIITALTSPAKAAIRQQYNASDYVSGWEVDGDTIHATFSFDDVAPLAVNIVNYDTFSSGKALWSEDGRRFISDTFTLPENTYNYLMRTYAGGVQCWSNTAAWGGVFYIGDIMPGAELTLTGSYNYAFECYAINGYPGIGISAVARSGVYLFDSDGGPLGTILTTEETIAIPPSGHNTLGVIIDHVWELPRDVQYIIPFYDLDVTFPRYDDYPETGSYVDGWTFTGFFDPFTISTDINMIYKESLTMDAIKDELGEVTEKMDELLSGGEAGAELEEESEKLDDAGDSLGDAMSDYKDASGALPSLPSDMGSFVDSDAVDDAVSSAGDFLDWEKSGLSKMYVPMGLSVSFSLLFYIIFGKKG